MDLIAFITARLDEDEQWARAAGWHRWQLGIVYGTVMALGNGKTVARDCREYDAEHIARHDPARVLREVEAKRRILAEHKPMDGVGDRIVGCHICSYRDDWDELHIEFPCATVRLLALPYADHPDYRPEWSPSA